MWLSLIALALLAGWIVWAASDERGLPTMSLWLWLGAVAIACVPLLVMLVYGSIAKLARRKPSNVDRR